MAYVGRWLMCPAVAAVCVLPQVPWCEQEEGALGGQGHAQQEMGLQVRSLQKLMGGLLQVDTFTAQRYSPHQITRH
jgi:hypothetical protein